MDIAEIIKSRITMTELATSYGFEPNRAGFICCPFHNEKTASIKIYPDNRAWYCYGCNAGGDIITFTQKLHRLNFRQALEKLNDDFALGLESEGKPSYREKQKAMRALKERKAKIAAEKKAAEEINNRYRAAFDEWSRLSMNRINFKPKTDTEELKPEFIESLQKLGQAEWELDCAELERWKNGRNHNT